MAGSKANAPLLLDVNSYKIFQRRRSPATLTTRIERWVLHHQVLAVPAALVAIGSLRSVNVTIMSRVLAPIFNSLAAPMIGRNILGVIACVSALVGLINPRKSPHRAVSSIYYRIISSLFVPRFVTNSVWAISADSVDWKQLIGVSMPASVAGSQTSSGASDLRSFRIPNSSFTKRRYARSVDGRRVLVEGKEKARDASVPRLTRAKSVDYAHPNGSVPTPGQSPRALRLRNSKNTRQNLGHGQHQKRLNWEPKMSRIVSGQSLTLAELQTAATRKNKQILVSSLSVPDAVTPPTRSIPEEMTCPLSPAGSIESSASFSRSVSDYVDSWLQSLKGGTVAVGGNVSDRGCVDESEARGVCSPRRSSLDAHGAHRHYVHGTVTASDATIVPLLDKYALSAQLKAKNLIENTSGGNIRYPGHLVTRKGSFASSVAMPASVLDSIGLDGDCPDAIRHIITDEHLLQFGELIGDSACSQLLQELSIQDAFASPSSLFGIPDAPGVLWEKSASGGTDGMTVAAERKLLRDNYYMYRTVAHIHGVEPSDVRPFHLDDQARSLWDESCISCERDTPPGETRVSKHSESCMHRYVSRFPRPLSGRSYEYARRVWTRPSDGGCYAICKSCTLPSGQGPSKYCLVKEYVSACAIEATEQGTRITTVYFENNQARPGLNKIAVPKGLLPFWFKYESSLRVFAQAKRVNTTRRRSLDEPTVVEHDNKDATDSSSELGSDDEVYDALAELKRQSKEQDRKRRVGALPRGENEKITKWVRRIIVAGAVKLAMEDN